MRFSFFLLLFVARSPSHHSIANRNKHLLIVAAATETCFVLFLFCLTIHIPSHSGVWWRLIVVSISFAKTCMWLLLLWWCYLYCHSFSKEKPHEKLFYYVFIPTSDTCRATQTERSMHEQNLCIFYYMIKKSQTGKGERKAQGSDMCKEVFCFGVAGMWYYQSGGIPNSYRKFC